MKKIYLASLIALSSVAFYSCGESKPEIPAELAVNELTIIDEDGKEIKLENIKVGDGYSTKSERKDRTDLKFECDKGTIQLMFNFATIDIKPGEYEVAKGIDMEDGKQGLLAFYVKLGDESYSCCGMINDKTSYGTVKITTATETAITGEIDATSYDDTKLKGKFYAKVKQREF